MISQCAAEHIFPSSRDQSDAKQISKMEGVNALKSQANSAPGEMESILNGTKKAAIADPPLQ